jgi:hypothetical protein
MAGTRGRNAIPRRQIERERKKAVERAVAFVVRITADPLHAVPEELRKDVEAKLAEKEGK